MRNRLAVAMLCCSALLAGVAVVVQHSGRQVDALGTHVLVVPGLAADSAGAAGPPTPTPTPLGGGGSQAGLKVTLIISIRALELSATASGTTPVLIDADATIDMPTAQFSSAAPGTFSITDHPNDEGGCAYPRTDVSTGFSVIVYHVDDQGILMGLTSPEWHYTITCPNGAPPIRLPAFGEESLDLFLRDVMGPYFAQVNTVQLPLISTNTPGCLKQYGTFSASGIEADPAQVYVYVHEANCSLPPLLPLPPPSSPTPHP